MSLMTIMAILLGGVFAGFLTGLLGVGGGVVMVPTLYQIFLGQGVTTRTAFMTAVATSLFVMIFSGAYAAYIHRQNGLLDRNLVLWTGLGTIFGAIFGAHLLIVSDDRWVRFGFGIFLWAVAASMYLPTAKERLKGHIPSTRYKAGLVLTGILMGIVSGLFGIGGTTLVVPALVVFFGVTIHQAIATATALIVVTALSGASSYLLAGFNDPQTMIPGAGWVHPLAALVMILGAFTASRLGIRIAMRIPRPQLKGLMVVFQLIVGARFIFF
jgi:hypothetical protein